MALSLPKFYPILDASVLPTFERGSALRRIVSDLQNAGVTLLQYRNKLGSPEDILADALELRKIAQPGLTLIMNDHPHLAVQAEFDGVHVGQDDVSPEEARRIVGPDLIVGASTHTLAQVEAADGSTADYIAIGPVFDTTSKLSPDPVIGLEGVRKARELTRKPLVAIGGIRTETARGVLDAGADSVAVISAIFGRDRDTAKAVREFLAL